MRNGSVGFDGAGGVDARAPAGGEDQRRLGELEDDRALGLLAGAGLAAEDRRL
jgi:hypothetical protein